MDTVVIEQRDKITAVGLADLLAKCERVLTVIFGCWHSHMNNPFTRDGETYRVCMSCGARRRFDLERWQTVGPFYYEEPLSHLGHSGAFHNPLAQESCA